MIGPFQFAFVRTVGTKCHFTHALNLMQKWLKYYRNKNSSLVCQPSVWHICCTLIESLIGCNKIKISVWLHSVIRLLYISFLYNHHPAECCITHRPAADRTSAQLPALNKQGLALQCGNTASALAHWDTGTPHTSGERLTERLGGFGLGFFFFFSFLKNESRFCKIIFKALCIFML